MNEAVTSNIGAAADAATTEAISHVETGARAASDIASEGANIARDAMSEGRTVGVEQIDAARTWLEEAARVNPLRAVGIAGAVGLAVGWLLLKKNR